MTQSQSDTGYKLYPNCYIDAIEDSENYFRPVWGELAREIRNHQVVDIGCGSGRYTASLAAEYGCRMIGIDGSTYALERALARGFSNVYEVADLSRDSLPLEDATCEIAVNKDVLEHLLDPLHLLREINRILVPGGKLMLHVPNHFPLLGRLRFLFNGDIDPLGFCLGANAWENPHIRFFRYEDIESMLSLSGFTILRNLSYHFPAIPWLHRYPARLRSRIRQVLTDKYPSEFCGGFTVWAQKDADLNGSEAAR